MTSSMMRPGNFRHDTRGTGVVEVSMAEYLRSKKSILKKIRRRLLILGCFIGLTALTALILGAIVAVSYDKIVKFHRHVLHVSLGDLYFVYGGIALLFSFHGFYIDGHWVKMQKDGNRFVMHLRLYSVLGLLSCVGAVWLGYATLAAFGVVDIRIIFKSDINKIYLATLVTLCVHLIVTPWLLRTVHRKASQADEYFSAEFMHAVKQDSKRSKNSSDEQYEDEVEEQDDGHEHDDDDDDDEEEVRDRRSVVVPASSPREKNKYTNSRSPTKSRHAFYNADGTSSVMKAAVAHKSPRSPRSKREKSNDKHHRGAGDAALSPRSMTSPRASMGSQRDHQSVGRAASPRGGGASYREAQHTTVQEGLVTASSVSNPDQIPYASPVFCMDHHPRLQPVEFWRLWKISETTGSFSCPFNNQPRPQDIDSHLTAYGFHVVAIEAKDSALQVYFYAHQLGTDVFFLGEFVFLFSRQFFQATFKCKDHEAAPEFVARFNLQELQVVDQ